MKGMTRSSRTSETIVVVVNLEKIKRILYNLYNMLDAVAFLVLFITIWLGLFPSRVVYCCHTHLHVAENEQELPAEKQNKYIETNVSAK